MPARFRAAVRKSLGPLAEKSSGVSISTEGRVFFCPSCSTWRRRMFSTTPPPPPATTNRHRTRNRCSNSLSTPHNSPEYNVTSIRRFLSSSVSSHSTAAGGIVDSNSRSTVPARFRELYTTLKELEEVAADHISLSRLQLALRGLESEEPVIRVGSKFYCTFLFPVFLLATSI